VNTAAIQHVQLPEGVPIWRRALGFAGPGFLVSVGYMDPGNWATDLAAGSRYGYQLLFVVLASSIMAMILQSLALRLGIATDRDLAQLCREHYSRRTTVILWVIAELAIAACDLAEVIGSAIALNLLFHLPLLLGVILTALDVLLILLLEQRGYRYLEAVVIALIATIGVLFGIETLLARPELLPLLKGMILPSTQMIRNPQMLYISIGILGATVMPHNLYLHSSIVQTRNYKRTPKGRQEAMRFAGLDSMVALSLAFFVNAAILIVASAVFHRSGHFEVAEIGDAYNLLSPLLGAAGASTIFAIALLASGQNSTLTGTLAGQIVMEGFLDLRLPPWLRRLTTRLLAIIPAVIVTAFYGSTGIGRLLLLSQVILSLQLSFAVVPLVIFTCSRKRMGEFVNGPFMRVTAWTVAVVIAVLNGWLLILIATGQSS